MRGGRRPRRTHGPALTARLAGRDVHHLQADNRGSQQTLCSPCRGRRALGMGDICIALTCSLALDCPPALQDQLRHFLPASSSVQRLTLHNTNKITPRQRLRSRNARRGVVTPDIDHL
ncbi:hypothetical protein GDO81_010428 [Engystomops pustulosus]|uniref:Uncharacterized protein n=1 Tax=Engystomops pustulosus TaxID=76066 RepID=A0AAV7C1B2_ENGPU|nr:hypothetical protein GDO81_010428 [Engystomops pustulosus]